MRQRTHSAPAASLATLLALLSFLSFYRRCESAGEHYSGVRAVAALLCHLERRERIVVTPRARCGKSLYPGFEGCLCI